MRIGVDLGGTKTEAIALDAVGRIRHRLRVPTVPSDYAATLSTIEDLVFRLEAELGETASVGVGIPGTIVASSGRVKNANSTWLNGKPLAQDLSHRLRREVRCSNDANCFALSEATDGAGTGAAVVFGAILGTGCGGGLVVNGRVLAGSNGLTGEWGHMPLPWAAADELPGPACYCGRRGCLEAWISGPGFQQDFQRTTKSTLTAPEIMALAERGNEAAIQAFARLRSRLARGLALIVDLLDPEVIVLGGGLSNIEDFYSGDLQAEIADWTFGGNTQTPIRRNQYGDSSGVRGAAWLWPVP